MRILFILIIIFLFPPKVHAYIDPGTGSYIFQTIIAVFLGLAVSFRFFWKYIKSSLNRLVASFRQKKK
ncbi:MAG: hypothetical protein UV73_C0001G0112 [Candidatus Gottesmanbacteria bacterium GW2011_GWA2_43_14]|uniref:Uncharacterized protein n=1 Tax=Candidatus Gottesmanbacteria bacterium GW2011_GWA2_43_14 TaxID=1618443 RepID=A0A0G1FUE4_9BACT|nr:MAG: hypothetical protein UV73_C0001G0112 [Candidatus Gottesmanbacteria bacterium GW2011_GWA2_43_14]